MSSECIITTMLLIASLPATSADLDSGKHGFVESGDIKIHYVTMGDGPPVVMIHGFPDYWYTWRKQIPALAKDYQVVAIDQRGYNKSGQPEGVKNCQRSSVRY